MGRKKKDCKPDCKPGGCDDDAFWNYHWKYVAWNHFKCDRLYRADAAAFGSVHAGNFLDDYGLIFRSSTDRLGVHTLCNETLSAFQREDGRSAEKYSEQEAGSRKSSRSI